MSIGIYKYQNKINGKIYIGQSIQIEERFRQHLYDSTRCSINEVTGIDFAICKYGIENFDFSILEQCNIEQLDEKERYWIAYYDSYNNGYNRTPGGKALRGSEHPKAILNENQVWEIRELYNQKVKRNIAFQAFKQYGISERGFKKIWDGENWSNIHMDVYTEENKLWHKSQTGHSEDQIGLSSDDRTIKQTEIDLWVKEYNEGLSINAIAKKYKRDNGVVEKYIHNPIAVKKVQYRGRKLQNINTKKIFNSINSAAKWAGCGATTLTRHLATDKIAGKVPETGEPAEWLEIS